MVRPVQHRVLLIGDPQREVYGALAQALPAAHLTSVGSVFEGIAELASETFTPVLAAAEPIERRPEAAAAHAARTGGRQPAGFCPGHPTLELLGGAEDAELRR